MGFEDKLHDFEDRWQAAWEEQEVFQPDPDERDKFFITVAYPYPSGGMHLGHVGTYTLPDVFARFKKMQGYNVLFPMAWHVTGTPIIGALNRLKKGEEEQLHVLKDVYNVPQEDLDAMEEPMDFAEYFIENSYKKNMQDLGFGVDWRREFTTNDERYSKFIQWQYRKLKQAGYLEQGKHPTKYCLDDDNPVTTHDLLEGEDADMQEYTLVRFRKDDKIFPMATLRPETVYGVTHALVDPDGDYVEVEVDGEARSSAGASKSTDAERSVRGETWIVSAAAAEKLEHQEHDVEIEREFTGDEIIGEEVMNPVTGDEIMLLPATFVDTESATGVVMSVPAHAPYDWISLQDLKQNEALLEEHGIDPATVQDIEPVSIIDVEGYGEFPAKEACEEFGVTSQDDEEALEEATEEIYKKEHHTGRLKSNCQEFAGQSISEAKEELKRLYANQNKFGEMWDFSEDVVCRCGGRVIVAEADTWFLTYGDRGWKDKADKVLNQLRTIPANTREDYEHTINWLESWPCIRNYGLGTELPFDERFKVEPLSDSTIYMAYYTIKHLIEDIDPEQLNEDFFDYVFRGEGPVEDVVDSTGVDEETLKEARESFEYWYPLDWRTSANELIQNHLTFFMFHHAAIFDEKHWPQGIATWGMGLLEGEKMSSSKGHVILPENAIADYGADTVRFFMFASCEPWQDFDWREDEVVEYRKKLQRFHKRTLELYGSGEQREPTRIDRYVRSRLNRMIQNAEDALEDFQTRKASINAFFELNNLINWYRQRADTLNQDVIEEVLDAQIRMMAPFIPHLCEQLWDETGHRGLVTEADWPEVDPDAIDDEVEAGEELLKATIDDIQEIEDMVGDYDTVHVALAADWKREAVRRIKTYFDEHGDIDIGALMDELTGDSELREYADQLSGLVKDYKQNPGELPGQVLATQAESEVFEEAQGFLADRFDADIEIEPEDVSSHDKAERARPGKPAIILE
ncbi:MAG: leucine--tRNA ligase [Candidatus Nanohaloarchaea archaeon]|nr:leucine--tRNA ligase [Candidatus Nanohaloarchaea archaeon]